MATADRCTIRSVDAEDASALVAAMHVDLTGAAAEAGTQERLAAELAAHGDCSRTLHELLVGDECAGRMITNIYRSVHGRAPDRDQLSAYVTELRAGRLSLANLPLVLLEHVVRDESRTFESRTALVYAVVLAREVSVAETEFWRRGLRSRTPSSQLRQVWGSPEAVSYRVAELYRTHLWRDPDQAGTSTWGPTLLRDGDEPVRAGLVSSLEYLLLARRRNAVRTPASTTV